MVALDDLCALSMSILLCRLDQSALTSSFLPGTTPLSCRGVLGPSAPVPLRCHRSLPAKMSLPLPPVSGTGWGHPVAPHHVTALQPDRKRLQPAWKKLHSACLASIASRKQVYCGNYEYDASERELERMFEKYGPVNKVEFKTGAHLGGLPSGIPTGTSPSSLAHLGP